MARGSKAKKKKTTTKAGSAKKRVRAKAAVGKARATRGASDDASEMLRASAKSFAARLLR
jgi:hypothetical protein